MNPYTVVAIVIAAVLFVLALVFRRVRRRRKHDQLIELITKFDELSGKLYVWAKEQTLVPGPLGVGFDEESRGLLRQIAELSPQIERLSDELDEYDWALQFRISSFVVFPFYPLFTPPEWQDEPQMVERRREMGELLSAAIELIFAPPRRVRVVA